MELKLSLNKQEFDKWLNMVEKAGKLKEQDIEKLRALNNERVEPLSCKRCNHSWLPRTKKLPKVCPKCNSPYWNKKRVRNLK